MAHIFTPVATGAGGGWADPGTGKAGDHNDNHKDSKATTYLFQQFTVALQKGNAVSFQNTFIAG